MLDATKIKNGLTREIVVSVFDVIDSTNSEAKRLAAEVSGVDMIPRLIIAREQTAGRGRMGRSFVSRADAGIFMSLLYFTDKPLTDVVTITTAAAAIVAEAIESVSGRAMRIKWVNDIYDDAGKVCGILAETAACADPSRRAVIVGIGINTGEADFPDEIKGIASTIGNVSGREEALISVIASGLLSHSDDPADKKYMAAYRARFMLEGEEVNLLKNGETVGGGRVLGVDDNGGLLLLPDGEGDAVCIQSGEVSVRIKNNFGINQN